MHVKASLGLYLKNAPKTHLSIKGESWQIGNTPMTPDELIADVAITVADFCRTTGMSNVFEANAMLRAAAQKIVTAADKMDARLEELRQEAIRLDAEGKL